MYTVTKQQHPTYGNVVIISHTEEGEVNPFHVVLYALKEQRLWQESGTKHIRFLVDGQIMTPNQMELWAKNEYQGLPTCATCAQILSGDVHTHQLCGSSLFCSQTCADRSYDEEMEKLKDEEECEFT